MENFWSECWKAIVKWWKKTWFESKLTASMQMMTWENQKKAVKEIEENFKPIYTEEKSTQKGEASKLGGAMRLSAKWNQDSNKK
ncbi:MAG: hypothetical protein CMD53_05005 [Gammaproteobacteria bacterium]|mgnify:CR=1 FL=1|jgi:hypothetical protein|nr:hypothetical protein [Gammaproteobacteria bacterium]|tara:strand:+ start:2767 stop:3018 length:252 start_codon:yes stop_codon:yes gene_type:complete